METYTPKKVAALIDFMFGDEYVVKFTGSRVFIMEGRQNATVEGLDAIMEYVEMCVPSDQIERMYKRKSRDTNKTIATRLIIDTKNRGGYGECPDSDEHREVFGALLQDITTTQLEDRYELELQMKAESMFDPRNDSTTQTK